MTIDLSDRLYDFKFAIFFTVEVTSKVPFFVLILH